MQNVKGSSGALVWTEVWELREEMQRRWGMLIEVKLVPPSDRDAKNYAPPQVWAVAHTFGKNPRAVAQRKVFVSSVRGASTYEAAAHRALSELYWYLEESEAGAAKQAAF